jgi:signal transduction histidine kinase
MKSSEYAQAPSSRPETAAAAGVAVLPRPASRFGLSERLLALTVAFVLMAVVLIYLPAVAVFRDNWLRDRLSAAQTAALVLEAAPADMLPEGLVDELLNSVGARSIAMKLKGTRRLLAASDNLPMTERRYDLRESQTGQQPMIWLGQAVVESVDTLINGTGRNVSALGDAPMGGDFVEIMLDETPLRVAMLGFSRTALLIALVISGLTGALVYLALAWMIVRPVRRLTDNIVAFAAEPENVTRIMQPSTRKDELGQAEKALSGMQKSLVQQLRQRERLAQLGLSVSKINHDLRNMLTAAHLMSDRLSAVSEPTVQRFAPKLISTLDRAISFCESTLSFGKAQERVPEPGPVKLAALVEEVREFLPQHEHVAWHADVPTDLVVMVDQEYLFRILLNLTRNAVQALEARSGASGQRDRRPDKVGISVTKDQRWLHLIVWDNGPGIPEAVKARLFEAFQGGGRAGSTGLGLAIAADLARRHGGSLCLLPENPAEGPGARFEIRLPLKLAVA